MNFYHHNCQRKQCSRYAFDIYENGAVDIHENGAGCFTNKQVFKTKTKFSVFNIKIG